MMFLYKQKFVNQRKKKKEINITKNLVQEKYCHNKEVRQHQINIFLNLDRVKKNVSTEIIFH